MRIFTTKATNTHHNPVALALEWRHAIDSGHYSSQADLARKKGISRARVTPVLNLLRLAPGVIEIIRGWVILCRHPLSLKGNPGGSSIRQAESN